MKALLKNSILPILLFLVLAVFGRYIFIVDGEVDWFRAMLVFGIPYGIPHMLFVIPVRGSAQTIAAILALDVIAGAALGCFIAAWILLKAVVNLVAAFIRLITGRIKRTK